MLAEKGCSRDLFPTPETVDGNALWIVEGEPDGVAAHSLGLSATAVPGTNGCGTSGRSASSVVAL
jgi:hypothetical protein